MSTDIRLSEGFYDHPKTFALEKKLGIQASRSLTILWLWAAKYRVDGILRNLKDEYIEYVAKWEGETGVFISTLIELHWLDVLQDGTYALHEWVEHNPWVADADNRSDKARLLGMAKNYPELYEGLVAQGYTGIDKANYARLTSEYSARGILRSSSTFLRTASVAAAPTPKPTPALDPISISVPVPFIKDKDLVLDPPVSIPTTEPKSPSASSSSQDQKTVLSTQTVQIKTRLETKDEPENPANQGEKTVEPKPQTPNTSSELVHEPATLEQVLSQWNIQLGALGFPKVQK